MKCSYVFKYTFIIVEILNTNLKKKNRLRSIKHENSKLFKFMYKSQKTKATKIIINSWIIKYIQNFKFYFKNQVICWEFCIRTKVVAVHAAKRIKNQSQIMQYLQKNMLKNICNLLNSSTIIKTCLFFKSGPSRIDFMNFLSEVSPFSSE